MPLGRFGRHAGMSLLGIAVLAAGWGYGLAHPAKSSASVQIPTTAVSFASAELDALPAFTAERIYPCPVGTFERYGVPESREWATFSSVAGPRTHSTS